MKITQYDTVELKNGQTGTVIELNGEDSVDIDIGSSPKDWETLWAVPISEIKRVIHHSE